jgi:hypothetical protein
LKAGKYYCSIGVYLNTPAFKRLELAQYIASALNHYELTFKHIEGMTK